MKNDPVAYDRFFEEFGIFIKEGICTDMRMKDELSSLLRFDSSHTPDSLISLDTYVDRMKVEEKILFVCLFGFFFLKKKKKKKNSQSKKKFITCMLETVKWARPLHTLSLSRFFILFLERLG
jgi:HSP90 family molecular chaperone